MKLEIKKEWSNFSLCDRFFVYIDEHPIKVFDSFEDAKEATESIKNNAKNSREAEILWTETF